MIFRGLISRSSPVVVSLLALLWAAPGLAQERVSVATMRSSANGALFLAAARGYFKDEGITLDMTAYTSDAEVVKAMASGATDFGLANWSVETVKLAGEGAIKAVAAQIHEKDGYEGNEIVVSSINYDRGIHKLDDVTSGIIVVDQVGSTLHYQLEQAKRAKAGNLAGFTLKFAGSRAAAALAISDRRADVAVLPMLEARNLLSTNQAKLMVWCSQVVETELGALFASRAMLEKRRGLAEKFVRAYRRGAEDYFKAFLRLDKYSKRISNVQSLEAAKILAFYVYPRATLDSAMANVEGEVHYMDAKAQIDTADLGRRVAWYHAEGMIDKAVDAANLVDLNFK